MVVTKAWGKEKEKENRLIVLKFKICNIKSSKDLFHNNINVVNTTDLHI